MNGRVGGSVRTQFAAAGRRRVGGVDVAGRADASAGAEATNTPANQVERARVQPEGLRRGAIVLSEVL